MGRAQVLILGDVADDLIAAFQRAKWTVTVERDTRDLCCRDINWDVDLVIVKKNIDLMAMASIRCGYDGLIATCTDDEPPQMQLQLSLRAQPERPEPTRLEQPGRMEIGMSGHSMYALMTLSHQR